MEICPFIPLFHVWKTRKEGKQKVMKDFVCLLSLLLWLLERGMIHSCERPVDSCHQMPRAGWWLSDSGSLLFPRWVEYGRHGIHAAQAVEHHILKGSVAEELSIFSLKRRDASGPMEKVPFSVTYRKNGDMSCGIPVGDKAQEMVNTLIKS